MDGFVDRNPKKFAVEKAQPQMDRLLLVLRPVTPPVVVAVDPSVDPDAENLVAEPVSSDLLHRAPPAPQDRDQRFAGHWLDCNREGQERGFSAEKPAEG